METTATPRIRRIIPIATSSRPTSKYGALLARGPRRLRPRYCKYPADSAAFRITIMLMATDESQLDRSSGCAAVLRAHRPNVDSMTREVAATSARCAHPHTTSPARLPQARRRLGLVRPVIRATAHLSAHPRKASTKWGHLLRGHRLRSGIVSRRLAIAAPETGPQLLPGPYTYRTPIGLRHQFGRTIRNPTRARSSLMTLISSSASSGGNA